MAYTPDLQSLRDVLMTTPANGELLKYNGSKWTNSVVYLADLFDIPAMPVTGDDWFLSYNRPADQLTWESPFINIGAASQGQLVWDNSTRTLDIGTIAISRVFVDDTGATSMTNWVLANYTGSERSEGDIQYLPSAIGGTQVWIHNGGSSNTINDFTQLNIASGAMTSFTASGNTGIDQTISDSNTLSFVGSNGITTEGVNTNVISIKPSIDPPTGTTDLYLWSWDDNTDLPVWTSSGTLAGNYRFTDLLDTPNSLTSADNNKLLTSNSLGTELIFANFDNKSVLFANNDNQITEDSGLFMYDKASNTLTVTDTNGSGSDRSFNINPFKTTYEQYVNSLSRVFDRTSINSASYKIETEGIGFVDIKSKTAGNGGTDLGSQLRLRGMGGTIDSATSVAVGETLGSIQVYNNNTASGGIKWTYESGNKSKAVFSTGSTPVMTIKADGDIRLHNYNTTRNDSVTSAPSSFLYPDTDGNILAAPVSAIVQQENFATANLTFDNNRSHDMGTYSMAWSNNSVSNAFFMSVEGRFGFRTVSPVYVLDINTNTAIRIPRGTTAERPIANAGILRYNTDSSFPEFHNGTNWITLGQGDNMANANLAIAGTKTHTLGASGSWIINGATKPGLLTVGGILENVGIKNTLPTVSLDITGTDAIRLPFGTTAQRPIAALAAGYLRFNSELNVLEYRDNSSWTSVGTVATDTHFANTDLTFTANRTHDLAGYDLTLSDGPLIITDADGSPNLTLQSTGGFGSTINLYSGSNNPSLVYFGINASTTAVRQMSIEYFNGTLSVQGGPSPFTDILTIHKDAPLSLAIADDGIVSFPTTGALKLPSGTVLQRPTGEAGMLRFNSDLSELERHDGTDWDTIATGTTALTATQIAFGSASNTITSDSELYYNSTNKQLRVGGFTFGQGPSGATLSVGPNNGPNPNRIASLGNIDFGTTATFSSGQGFYSVGANRTFNYQGSANSTATDDIVINFTAGSAGDIFTGTSSGHKKFFQIQSGTGVINTDSDRDVTIVNIKSSVNWLDGRNSGSYAVLNFELDEVTSTALDLMYAIKMPHPDFTTYFEGRLGVGKAVPEYKVDINSTDAIRIPIGTTAQRPTGAAGAIRYNTTLGVYEGHNGTDWNSFALGGSDTNFGITDVTFTGNRAHDLAGFNLNIGSTAHADNFSIDGTLGIVGIQTDTYSTDGETMLQVGKITTGSDNPDGKITIAGYDNSMIEFNNHNNWARWQIKTHFNNGFTFANAGNANGAPVFVTLAGESILKVGHTATDGSKGLSLGGSVTNQQINLHTLGRYNGLGLYVYKNDSGNGEFQLQITPLDAETTWVIKDPVGNKNVKVWGMHASPDGKVGVGMLVATSTPSYTLDINGTDAIRIPVGTVLQRPTGTAGLLRFNSDSSLPEYHDGTNWNSVGTGAGTVTGTGTENYLPMWNATGDGLVDSPFYTDGVGNQYIEATSSRMGMNSGGLSYTTLGGSIKNFTFTAGTVTWPYSFQRYTANWYNNVGAVTNHLFSGSATVNAGIGFDASQILMTGTVTYNASATAVLSAIRLNHTVDASAGTKYRAIWIDNAYGAGIYQDGPSVRNYFAGVVGVGTDSSSQLPGYSATNLVHIHDESTSTPNIKLSNASKYGGLGLDNSRLVMTTDAQIRLSSNAGIIDFRTIPGTMLEINSSRVQLQNTGDADAGNTSYSSRILQFRTSYWNGTQLQYEGINLIGKRSSSTENDLYLNFEATSAIKLPTGTTVERPATGITGLVRYNTTIGSFEGYTGASWDPFATGGSDTNFAITDLTATANRQHDFATFDLTLTGIGAYKLDVNDKFLYTQGTRRFLHQSGGGGGSELYENLFFGFESGQSFGTSSTGYANTIIGRRAGFSLDGTAPDASSNTVMGYDAMRYNVVGSFNTVYGTVAGGGVSTDSYQRSSIFGYHAARYNTADDIAIFGAFAGENNTANATTAFGYRALRATTSATKNSAFGYYAGDSNTGESNTFFGYEAAGSGVGSGGYNVIIGTEAGRSLTGGNTNVLVGRRAGYIITSGGNNVVLGNNAGLGTITTGFGNIIIGYGRELSSAGVNNELNIGNAIYGENINSSSARIAINAFPSNDEAVFDLSGNTNAMILPTGSYAQRPQVSPIGGMIRYNSDEDYISTYSSTNSIWNPLTKTQQIEVVTASTTLDQTKEYVVFDVTGGSISQALPAPTERWKWSFTTINGTVNNADISTTTSIIYFNGALTNSVSIGNGERIDLNSDGTYYYATKAESSSGVVDTNFATNNLTLTGDREHDLDANNLRFIGGDVQIGDFTTTYAAKLAVGEEADNALAFVAGRLSGATILSDRRVTISSRGGMTVTCSETGGSAFRITQATIANSGTASALIQGTMQPLAASTFNAGLSITTSADGVNDSTTPLYGLVINPTSITNSGNYKGIGILNTSGVGVYQESSNIANYFGGEVELKSIIRFNNDTHNISASMETNLWTFRNSAGTVRLAALHPTNGSFGVGTGTGDNTYNYSTYFNNTGYTSSNAWSGQTTTGNSYTSGTRYGHLSILSSISASSGAPTYYGNYILAGGPGFTGTSTGSIIGYTTQLNLTSNVGGDITGFRELSSYVSTGDGVYNGLEIIPSITQTGGGTGITRGIFINPTLTNEADFRAIETTVGNVIFGGTAAIEIPVGTTAQRPTTTAGALRFNSTDSKLEYNDGTSWIQPGTGGSDTNMANTDLTLTNVRVHELADNTLQFDGNFGANILHLVGDGGNVGIGQAPEDHTILTLGGTSSLKLPRGTVAQRPSTPLAGMIRALSAGQTVEIYANSEWRPIEQTLNIVVTSTTSTIVMYKNTFLRCDITNPGATITLDPDNLATGSTVELHVTATNDFTLDSSTGNFVDFTSSSATKSITAGYYKLVWNGTDFYFI